MNLLCDVYKRTIETAENEFGKKKGMDIWQWDQGVAMYGFAKAYDATKDEKILDFIEKWTNYHLDKMDFGYSINTTAPLLGVLTLLENGRYDESYESVCKKFADWCLVECKRADRGVFEHTCTENTYDGQVWADTLFMGCIFLIKWGIYKNDNLYIKEAIRQFILHYKFLSDSETGLIYHGYDCNDREKKGVLWGRGNGWFAVASVEAIKLIPKNMIGYDKIVENFKKHFEGVVKFQNDDGTWNTVIDRKDTYSEMSVTAAFAYTAYYAVDLKIVDSQYEYVYEKGLYALKANIDKNGNVINGSLGTCVMDNYMNYNSIGKGYSYFMQGLAMIVLSCDK